MRKREYERTNQLSQFIYWTDVGKEGARYFKTAMKQKSMAESIAASCGPSMTIEKTQKLIRKAIEFQDNADSARSSAYAERNASNRASRNNGSWNTKRRTPPKSGSAQRSPRRRSPAARPNNSNNRGSARGRGSRSSSNNHGRGGSRSGRRP